MYCDLTQAVTFRGINLNSVTLVAGTGPKLQGCSVDSFDTGAIEIRQFREPMALVDGIDVGGVWLGGRHPRMSGTVYDTTRAAAFARLATLEAVMLPVSGTFGFYPLVFTGGTLSVMPLGLRMFFVADRQGGHSGDALAIPWSVSFYCKDPL
jgi:hypothetical protein